MQVNLGVKPDRQASKQAPHNLSITKQQRSVDGNMLCMQCHLCLRPDWQAGDARENGDEVVPAWPERWHEAGLQGPPLCRHQGGHHAGSQDVSSVLSACFHHAAFLPVSLYGPVPHPNHTYTNACVHTHTHIHMYTHMHACTHAHTDTHACMLMFHPAGSKRPDESWNQGFSFI